MEYAAYDRVREDGDGGTLPRSSTARAGSSSEALTMPCVKPAVDSAVEEACGEGPRSMPWCVDRGQALEAMSSGALWQALESGALPPETRVWREGLECWTEARQVRELRWTVSRLDRSEEAAGGDAATALVSAGMTPAELGPVRDWAGVDPAHGYEGEVSRGSREERSVLPTMVSTPEPSPSETPELSERALSHPISLELPTSFPVAPPPATSRASGAQREVGAASASGEEELPLNVDRAARLPEELSPVRASRLQRFAARLGRRRDAVLVAAGFSLAGVAIGAALAETWEPPQALALDVSAALPPDVTSGTSAPAGEDVSGGDSGASADVVGVEAAPSGEQVTQSGPRCAERGQHRLRRGHADRFRGRRADAAGAERADSR
ncbi:DUF4339 domain-containing protein [Chondromyces apiculatus]|nr:DUF4339 domain-containing protein [Chondromyces apiculatus]